MRYTDAQTVRPYSLKFCDTTGYYPIARGCLTIKVKHPLKKYNVRIVSEKRYNK